MDFTIDFRINRLMFCMNFDFPGKSDSNSFSSDFHQTVWRLKKDEKKIYCNSVFAYLPCRLQRLDYFREQKRFQLPGKMKTIEIMRFGLFFWSVGTYLQCAAFFFSLFHLFGSVQFIFDEKKEENVIMITLQSTQSHKPARFRCIAIFSLAALFSLFHCKRMKKK